MATLYKPMDVQVDGDGLSMAGAKLYFYQTGTSTPQDTYSDAGLTTPNSNPVLADGDGLWPPIYMGTTDYKAILKTAADVAVQTIDPVLINPATSGLSAQLDDQFGSTQFSLLQRGASAWQAVTLKAVLDNKFTTTPGTGIVRGASDWLAVPSIPQTNSLGADVTLSNGTAWFDGPSVAQGADGTWEAAGTVTVAASATSDTFYIKLWDGTTTIASCAFIAAAAVYQPISLSGFIASPAGNIRISVKCITSTTAKIIFNASGESKDSTLTVVRRA